MYKQNVTLSDGTTGEVNAKSEGKWKVGDEVEVKNRQETNYGTRLSLSKPESGGGAGYRGGGGNDKERFASICYSYAKDMFCAGKIGRNDIADEAKLIMEEIKGLAQ